jgi:SecD/SecF fusion protein
LKKVFGKILLIIVPVIFGLYWLYPTYKISDLESKKAQVLKEATGMSQIDSIRLIQEWKDKYGEDYQETKAEAIKLGLDLRGGMYVTLEVDIVKLIDESAQKETKDQIFDDVIAKTAIDAQDSDAPVLDLFLENFQDIAGTQGKSLINYFDIGDFKDASEDRIIEKLQRDISGAVDLAMENIRQRVDSYGVTEPTIQKQGSRRILLELPGVNDEKEMRQYLKKTARLEFNLVRNNKVLVQTFWKMDQALSKRADLLGFNTPAKVVETPVVDAPATEMIEETTSQTFTAVDEEAPQDTMTVVETDTTDVAVDETTPADTTNEFEGLSEEEAEKLIKKKFPFSSLFAMTLLPPDDNGKPQHFNFAQLASPETLPEGKYSFFVNVENLDKFEQYLALPEINALIPFDVKILREANSFEYQDQTGSLQNAYNFYAVKAEPELTGDVIVDALATFDPTTNRPEVTMEMDSDGSEKWARITGANVGKRIAVVLDDWIYTAPNVITKISGGRSVITGMSDTKEATLIQNLLRAGALKVPVEIIEERVVGPSLGEDSINDGFQASMIAFLIVIIYMALYYNKAGFIANFAVILNVFLVISILAGFGGTLTLPGIAGIILTIGMAVDANVLIFERVREELNKGRSLRSAIDEGYTKALSAILDSNITTFATGLILFYFGTGPIQGFAMTLMIGILMTLFTAIIITRQFVEISMARGATQFSFGQPKVQD